MTAPVADTIGNSIIEDINALILSGHFADPASLEVRRLKAQIEKLKKVDAKLAYTCMAALNQACGEEAEMRNNHKRVRDLGSETRNFTNEMTGLYNLGYITDSHTLFNQVAKPAYGAFSELVNHGWNILAFNALSAYAKRIEKMATDIPEMTYSRIYEVAAFLQSHGINDDTVAEFADIAGQLLREHKLFTSSNPAVTVIDKDLDCLFIEYCLPTTPLEAAQIHAEFSRRLAEKYDVIPPHIYIDMVATA